MKTSTMQVVKTMILPTVNREERQFIVSINSKGQYFAHELGGLTQWAKVFNTDEYKAHRLNPTVKRGNQYGRYFKAKPLSTIDEAEQLINRRSKEWCLYA